jgi:outer membrane receptor protein involved in Fe transport
LDADLTLVLSEALSVEGSYSWVSRNWFTRVSGIGDVALNAPRHKGALTLKYAASPGGIAARAALRYVGGFPVKSGIFAGQVNPYAVLDADLSLPAPGLPRARLSIVGTNLLQAAPGTLGSGWSLRARHREFVRVPEMGRVLLARVELAL